MQTITLKAHTNHDGLMTLQIPTALIDGNLEVVIVINPLIDEQISETLDEMGYPIGFFERTYGMSADEPLERNQPLFLDTRDEIE